MIKQILYFFRNLAYSELFKAIRENTKGDILDIGGGEFYRNFLKIKITFNTYTIVDKREISILEDKRERVYFKKGDVEKLDFDNDSFDTIFCIHLLEHTLNPEAVISEMYRVLKRGGKAIILIPQTSVAHDIPEHYYNFTRYYIKEVLNKNGFKIEKIIMLGGAFFTIASHLFHLPLYIFNHHLYRDKEIKRTLLYYSLLPIKILLLPILFVIAILLSIGDIKEMANNILVVGRKE
ncbi:MAG: class I SAM-dependent methyltransferase [Myxococcota bacterium]